MNIIPGIMFKVFQNNHKIYDLKSNFRLFRKFKFQEFATATTMGKVLFPITGELSMYCDRICQPDLIERWHKENGQPLNWWTGE